MIGMMHVSKLLRDSERPWQLPGYKFQPRFLVGAAGHTRKTSRPEPATCYLDHTYIYIHTHTHTRIFLSFFREAESPSRTRLLQGMNSESSMRSCASSTRRRNLH